MQSITALPIRQHVCCAIQQSSCRWLYRVNNWRLLCDCCTQNCRAAWREWVSAAERKLSRLCAPLWPGIRDTRRKKKTLIALRQQNSRTAGSARASSPLPAKLKHSWGRPDKKRERRRQFMMWPTFTHGNERQRLSGWSSRVMGGAPAGDRGGICSSKLWLVIHHCLHCSIHSSVTIPFIQRPQFHKDYIQNGEATRVFCGETWRHLVWSSGSPGSGLPQMAPSAKTGRRYFFYIFVSLQRPRFSLRAAWRRESSLLNTARWSVGNCTFAGIHFLSRHLSSTRLQLNNLQASSHSHRLLSNSFVFASRKMPASV